MSIIQSYIWQKYGKYIKKKKFNQLNLLNNQKLYSSPDIIDLPFPTFKPSAEIEAIYVVSKMLVRLKYKVGLFAKGKI